MAEVKKPHGCIGCAISVALVLLCSFAVGLVGAIRVSRYASGFTLDCGTDETQDIPALNQVVLVIAPGNCWTDWVTIPQQKRYSISASAPINEQLFYSDGSTEVWQNSPDLYRTLEKQLYKLRFRNDSEAPIRITIRLTAN